MIRTLFAPRGITVIGALDTKGPEFAFVKVEIMKRGQRALVINTAAIGEPATPHCTHAVPAAQRSGSGCKCRAGFITYDDERTRRFLFLPATLCVAVT